MSKLSKHEKAAKKLKQFADPGTPTDAPYHYELTDEGVSLARGLFQFLPDTWSPSQFRPEANAMGALRAYWEHERLQMVRRIMMQRRQLRFLNRALKKRDGKLAQERLSFRETERRLLEQLALEREERIQLERRLYGVTSRSNPWAGK